MDATLLLLKDIQEQCNNLNQVINNLEQSLVLTENETAKKNKEFINCEKQVKSVSEQIFVLQEDIRVETIVLEATKAKVALSVQEVETLLVLVARERAILQSFYDQANYSCNKLSSIAKVGAEKEVEAMKHEIKRSKEHFESLCHEISLKSNEIEQRKIQISMFEKNAQLVEEYNDTVSEFQILHTKTKHEYEMYKRELEKVESLKRQVRDAESSHSLFQARHKKHDELSMRKAQLLREFTEAKYKQ
jgi:predicted  nucleic acid-binding Zn-ribbon protein